MPLFHPDSQDDEPSRLLGTAVPLDTAAGPDDAPGVESPEELLELEPESTEEEVAVATGPQTREAYLKKGEDLIRSLL
jgi:hypothetical protein